MMRCFDESHAAYQRGDGALSNQWSDEGYAHKAEMERLNGQASYNRTPFKFVLNLLYFDFCFSENNQGRYPS